jgi:hypothetical protein
MKLVVRKAFPRQKCVDILLDTDRLQAQLTQVSVLLKYCLYFFYLIGFI